MFARWLMLVGVCFSATGALPAWADVLRGEGQCGGMTAAASGVDWGPLDYRSAPASYKDRVEKYHFPPQVEQLKQGVSSAYIGADLDFVLRYFPNHVRALNSMTKLAKRDGTDQPRGSRHRLDCLYDRAVRMAPNDMQVRVLYGIWLAKKGERSLAGEQLDQVTEEYQDSLMLTYNLGLAYLDIGEYDKALAAAHKAYGGGFELPGLRNRLVKAGKWREPAPSKQVPKEVESESSQAKPEVQ